jgi:hypothetical protein
MRVNRFLRVLRGVMRAAVTWGVLWAVTAVVVATAFELLGAGRTINPARALVGVATFFTAIGAWAGGVFALMMAAAERRHNFAELTMARVSAWGALGGASLPLLIYIWSFFYRSGPPNNGLPAMLFCTILGTLSACGMLAMARRARGADAQLSGGMPEFSSGAREAEHVAR